MQAKLIQGESMAILHNNCAEDTQTPRLRVYHRRKEAPNQVSLWLDDTFSTFSGAFANGRWVLILPKINGGI